MLENSYAKVEARDEGVKKNLDETFIFMAGLCG
jgi:hypothetical protein